MQQYLSNSPQKTFALGKEISSRLNSGLTLALIGDLGTGKTTFAQGVAAGLGITEPIISPTFVVMKIYDLPQHKFLQQFCHIDAYRLNNAQELEAIGALDYLSNPKILCLIEWAEKIKQVLPNNSQIITFKHQGPKKRLIKITDKA